MVKIFIDPGHGGSDPGATGNGLQEKNLTLTIALKVRDLLANYENTQVRLSRENDSFISLTERAQMANNWGAEYFLSIHINAGGGTGFETYIHTNASSASLAYQNVIHPEILNQSGLVDRGKKRANYAVLRETSMPAILTENGFIDNINDASKLNQTSYLDVIAHGHVNGLVKAFGLKEKEESNLLYRLTSGAFPNAAAFARAVDIVKQKGWVVYEKADSLELNPTYRFITGTFKGIESANKAAEELRSENGWLIYVSEA